MFKTEIRRNTVIEMLEAYATKKGYTFEVNRRNTVTLFDDLKFKHLDRYFVVGADWNNLSPNAYDNFEYIRGKVEEALEPKPKCDIKLTKETLDYIKNDAEIRKPLPSIEKVVFNDPATIVFWADKTKTVVKAGPNDIFDPEKGLAMAIAKKALGNQGNYYNTIKKWLPEEKEPEFMNLEDVCNKIREINERLRAFSDALKGSDNEDEFIAYDKLIGTVTTIEETEEGVKATVELNPDLPRPWYVWFHGPDSTAWSRYNYPYKRKYSAERYAKKHFPDDWSWVVSQDYIWWKDEPDKTPEDYTWDYLSGDKE